MQHALKTIGMEVRHKCMSGGQPADAARLLKVNKQQKNPHTNQKKKLLIGDSFVAGGHLPLLIPSGVSQ